MWDLILSVPDHCLSFYLELVHYSQDPLYIRVSCVGCQTKPIQARSNIHFCCKGLYTALGDFRICWKKP